MRRRPRKTVRQTRIRDYHVTTGGRNGASQTGPNGPGRIGNRRPNTWDGAASDYGRAVDRVMSLADFERRAHSPGHSSFHLERMSALLAMFGDPHLTIPTIHVAGTKGKGSVAAMTAWVLSAQGHRTGLYTSPHLHTVRERIRVDGVPVTEAEFASLVDRTWPAVLEVTAGGGHGVRAGAVYGAVSTFEMMTLMAFVHFHAVGADAQVIEVGLGGRLDSTNLVRPLVSVITAISLDHVAILGDTVRQIATEKAGIIKPGVPVVVSPQPPGSADALDAIRAVADRSGAEVVEVGREADWWQIASSRDSQRFGLRTTGGARELTLPLLGRHQVENAATAVVTLERLLPHGLGPSEGALAAGLSSVDWPGRVEYLPPRRPGPPHRRGDGVVVVDGAHNTDSVERLMESVPELKRGRTVLVFGALGGHSAPGMLERLARLSPLLIAVRSRHPRATPEGTVADLAERLGMSVVGACATVAEGMARAVDLASAPNAAPQNAAMGTTVLVTGSISVAAEAREWALGIEPECYPNIRRPGDFPTPTAFQAAGTGHTKPST